MHAIAFKNNYQHRRPPEEKEPESTSSQSLGMLSEGLGDIVGKEMTTHLYKSYGLSKVCFNPTL